MIKVVDDVLGWLGGLRIEDKAELEVRDRASSLPKIIKEETEN